MSFMLEDKKYAQVVRNRKTEVHKQTCLCSKYLQANEIVREIFKDRVEVELQKNCCKVFDQLLMLDAQGRIGVNDVAQSSVNLTSQKISSNVMVQMLNLKKHLAIVNGFFFLEYPEYVSAHQKFIYDKQVVGNGGFVTRV